MPPLSNCPLFQARPDFKEEIGGKHFPVQNLPTSHVAVPVRARASLEIR